MQSITSRQNARVKEVAKLRRRRQRERQQRFIIDGRREISRALEAGIEVVEAFLSEQAGQAEQADALIALLEAKGAVVSLASTDVYDKLQFGDRNEGVVAVAKTPARSLDRLELPAAPLVAIVECLEKPGNVGAVLRSADGAGVDAVVVANPQTDLFNPNTIRASLGTVFADSICTATSAEILEWLRQRSIPMYTARPDGDLDYTQADLGQSAALILGSEAAGLSDAWRQDDVTPVRLPMLGIADSLNVSAAAAVLFYEARRQRNLAKG